MHSPHTFLTPDSLSFEVLLAKLASFGTLKEDPAQRFEDRYFDSFDWRLYQQGYAFLLRGKQAILRPLGSDAVHLHAQVEGVPRFFQDFAEGSLRSFLAAHLDVRALLPLATLVIERVPLRICDANGKTRLRLEWDEVSVGAAESPILRRVRVFLVTGYEAVARQVCAALTKLDCCLVQVDGDPLPSLPQPANSAPDVALQAMRQEGFEPGFYQSKPKLELRADMTGVTAAAAIFLKLADVIEANEQGIRDDIDIEFLHDFRVATRKTRAAISQLKRVFSPAELENYKNKFRSFGQLSNLMRDLDVYLHDADHYRQMLPQDQRADLEPFFKHLAATRQSAHAQLIRDLDAFDVKGFLAAWRQFWTDGEGPGGSAAQRPIGPLASKLLTKRYRKILADGDAIDDDTPDQKLHDLRIECKKLRYMLEFFGSLVSEKKLKYLVKQLKGLQDVLGRFNDFYVQQETLKDYAAKLGKTKAERQTVFAVGVLVGKLHQQQRDVRGAFGEAFAHFASADVQQMFLEICNEAREVSA